MIRVPGSVRVAVFLRSFLIQGSWNYRTMIGGGFGFAMLPALRWLYGQSQEELEVATGRHTEHFNAHPYMAGLALGSTVRLETDATAPDEVRRFKSAVRGPLGGLGDRLVWAGWLPTTLLIGLILVAGGARPAIALLAFLGLYNIGHVTFRGWAFRSGLEAGSGVARMLQGARLADKTDRIQGVGTLLLGVLLGLVGGRIVTGGPWGPALSVALLVAFVVGARVGPRVWRPMAGGLTLAIVILTLAGVLV